jgi:hypothetical protein
MKSVTVFVSSFVSTFVLTAGVFSMALAGCNKESEAAPPMTPASAPNSAARNAGEQIASARCDHEQRCNDIGPDKKYGSREHCMTVMRDDAAKSVNHCRNGIDQEDVRECLTDIQGQNCGNPFSSLMSSKECNSDDLCAD